MRVEIKELIRSTRQKVYVVKTSVDVLGEDEIVKHPAVQEIVAGNKFELERGVDSETAFWYLRLRE